MAEKYDLDKDPDYIAYMEKLHAASDRGWERISRQMYADKCLEEGNMSEYNFTMELIENTR